MFGAFLNFLTTLQAFKTKKVEQVKKKVEKKKKEDSLAKRLDIFKTKKAVELDEEVQDNKKKLAKEKAKLMILSLVTAIVSFFETLLIWVISLVGVLGFFIILMAVVIIIIVMSLINAFDIDLSDEEKNMTDIPDGMYSAELNWTEDELAIYGNLLTDAEKNYFRLIMLAKETVTSYPVIELTGDVNMDTRFLVGITSTETNMMFFSDENDNRDILKYPSNKKENDLSYGMYGIGASKTLDGYVGKDTGDAIRSKYTPVETPLTEARYAPWGVAMSAMHSSGDIVGQIKKDKVYALMDKVMAEYGIEANKERLKNISIWYLSQAEYHGADTSEYEAYLGFLYAFWAASSDNDVERDINNWSLTGVGYSESSYRHCFTGSKGAQDIEKNGDFTNITYGSNSTRIKLNGVELEKPLWGYLHDKYYTNTPAFQKAETLMLEFASLVTNADSSGRGLRVLNFHYGLNSYLQANRLMSDISAKLPLSQLGNASMGDNYTIKEETGKNTLLNLLATAMKPVGRTMYSWGGGRVNGSVPPIGFQPEWETFYNTQKERGVQYYFREWTTYGKRASGDNVPTGSPTKSTQINGLDCSGFVGWVIANNRNDGKAYIMKSTSQASTLKNWGLGTYKTRSNVTDYRPGDVMSTSGHVYMVIGPSEKGGVVLVHASPNGVKLGGFGGGEKTAAEYMEKYWSDVSDRKKAFNFGTYHNKYAGDYDQFRWNIVESGLDGGIHDKEGIMNMTAEEILKILFKEGN